PEGWVDRCRQFLDHLDPRIPEYHALLTTNHIFVQRTANLGLLTKELALSHGCTGPMLRGSLDRRNGDPDWDLRKLEPYCGYEQYNFRAAVPPFDDWDLGNRTWEPAKDAVPLRVRARSSSFSNLSVTDEICRNCLIADVPAIVGSIDIVMGEIDR